MAIEIERKFLVIGEAWRQAASPGRLFRQGYLATTNRVTVRVRREDDCASLTVKGPRSGLRRQEFTFPISVAEADDMLDRLCAGRIVSKVRHLVPYEGIVWHVDVFDEAAGGLVLAEIELISEQQPFCLPPWVGAEVSDDPRYRNSNIARAAGARDHDVSPGRFDGARLPDELRA